MRRAHRCSVPLKNDPNSHLNQRLRTQLVAAEILLNSLFHYSGLNLDPLDFLEREFLARAIIHAGLVYIPSRTDLNEKLLFAEIAAAFIQGTVVMDFS